MMVPPRRVPMPELENCKFGNVYGDKSMKILDPILSGFSRNRIITKQQLVVLCSPAGPRLGSGYDRYLRHAQL